MPPKQNTTPDQAAPPRKPTNLTALTLPFALVLLAAAASTVSQLTLAPVYGSIPSAVNHRTAILVSFAFGAGLQGYTISKDFGSVLRWLAVWSCYVPVLQTLLLPFSGRLGPVWGPALNGILSCHTVLVPCAYAVAAALDGAYAEYYGGNARFDGWRRWLVFIVVGLMFIENEKRTSGQLTWIFSLQPRASPVRLQLFGAASFALISFVSSDKLPSFRDVSLLFLATPAILHAVFLNPQVGLYAHPNDALATHNWTLMDRAWSNTGYISVLESQENKYRILRCDHSLLGGEWLLTPERASKEGWRVNEPIYSAFEMLEAVRLMQPATHETAVPDTSAEALVIGLGIGTAPKAMLGHGIHTTIVELDPVVHRFATEYFDLPSNHTSVLRDAVKWVAEQAANIKNDPDEKRYDYIIHDVFTGGAEPLALFNTKFLRNLRTLLKPKTGRMAINYAGDLSLPLTRLVLNTIANAFRATPNQCKIFRDAPPGKHSNSKIAQDQDFLNMVVFCRNSDDNESNANAGAPPISFRAPTEKDFLGSLSRQHYLLPRPEMEIPFPSVDPTAKQLLEPGDEVTWASVQAESAQRHWHIMRKVLPDAVWELW
ncbi:uncharacterized protein MYCFIDRAFT_152699 [Pseudocercospora fijiensis CIRAD86]|uniref:PABS domain-containing protein n=1 Tax=Pseudocercospora fijiensis (strain CIRAD86) TaxID=383855 RepID=M3B544_PSEFD|nr:uncharacterized protein MYCFIDRAFT_152699 [Pseudocercospora fijiensis CIRAD86]EME84472.1 hypothetical protein MYCFIDRAFT_152699 [Pseudocercospora fijiensis CIRAD86]